MFEDSAGRRRDPGQAGAQRGRPGDPVRRRRRRRWRPTPPGPVRASPPGPAAGAGPRCTATVTCTCSSRCTTGASSRGRCTWRPAPAALTRAGAGRDRDDHHRGAGGHPGGGGAGLAAAAADHPAHPAAGRDHARDQRPDHAVGPGRATSAATRSACCTAASTGMLDQLAAREQERDRSAGPAAGADRRAARPGVRAGGERRHRRGAGRAGPQRHPVAGRAARAARSTRCIGVELGSRLDEALSPGAGLGQPAAAGLRAGLPRGPALVRRRAGAAGPEHAGRGAASGWCCSSPAT